MRRVQFGLVEAIGKAPAWILTDDEITELENLTLGQERDNVKQWHWRSVVNVNVSFAGDQIIVSMNQYTASDLASLEAKLAQYPSGTKLWLKIFWFARSSVLSARDHCRYSRQSTASS